MYKPPGDSIQACSFEHITPVTYAGADFFRRLHSDGLDAWISKHFIQPRHKYGVILRPRLNARDACNLSKFACIHG